MLLDQYNNARFQPPTNKFYEFLSAYKILIAASGMMASFMAINAFLLEGSINGYVALAIIIVGQLLVVATMSTATEYRHKQIEARAELYDQYLSTIDKNVLREHLSSPEMSAESKYMITQHLNNKHAGWSVEIETVDVEPLSSNTYKRMAS